MHILLMLEEHGVVSTGLVVDALAEDVKHETRLHRLALLRPRSPEVKPLPQSAGVGLLGILVVCCFDFFDSECTLARCSSLGELALRDDACLLRGLLRLRCEFDGGRFELSGLGRVVDFMLQIFELRRSSITFVFSLCDEHLLPQLIESNPLFPCLLVEVSHLILKLLGH